MTSATIILRRHDSIAPNIGDDGQNAPNRYRKASSRRGGKPLQRPTRPSLQSIARRSARPLPAHPSREVPSARPRRKQRP
jgi:hypothetical protein